MADILKAVPINKYFELYKARATDQSEGGFIKVSIEYEDHSIRQRAGRTHSSCNISIRQLQAPCAPMFRSSFLAMCCAEVLKSICTWEGCPVICLSMVAHAEIAQES